MTVEESALRAFLDVVRDIISMDVESDDTTSERAERAKCP